MNIKFLYQVSFCYDDAFDDPIWFFGEFKESISESLESLFLKMDGLDKDHATNYFPDCVDVSTKKSVIIEGEEYFTERKPFNLFDKTELLNKFRNFLKKAS